MVITVVITLLNSFINAPIFFNSEEQTALLYSAYFAKESGYFLQSLGVVVERSKIYQDIWQSPYYIGNKTVEQFLHKLKNKLPTFKTNLSNIKGFGYKLIPYLILD